MAATCLKIGMIPPFFGGFSRPDGLGPELCQQFLQDRGLRRQDMAKGLSQREPLTAIDLREARRAAGARRPFHLELVAPYGGRIDLALDRPGMHDLPAALLDRRQRDERAVERLPHLLEELAPGGGEAVFSVVELALGDRPGAEILLGPEGSTWMHQEHV